MRIGFETKLDGYIEYLVSDKITEMEVEGAVNLREDKYKIVYQEVNKRIYDLEKGDKYSVFLEKDVKQYIYVYKTKTIYEIKYTYTANSKIDDIDNISIKKQEENVDFVKIFKSKLCNIDEIWVDDIKVKMSEKKEYTKGKYEQQAIYFDLSYLDILYEDDNLPF